MSGHRQAMVAWFMDAAFIGVTAVASSELFLRVELGSIAGAAMSGAAMGWFF